MSNPYRFGTKRHAIAKAALNGLSAADAYAEIKPLVLEQTRPFVFKSKNPISGLMEANSIPRQLKLLRDEINRVFSEMGRKDKLGRGHDQDTEDFDTNESEIETEDETTEDETESSENDDSESEIKPPKASGKTKIHDEKTTFMREWRRLRKWIADTVERTGAQAVDSLDSMRPVLYGRAAMENGIPAKAMIHSMCLHWPSATRDNAGVETFNPETISESQGTGFHKLTGYVLKLCRAGVPVMLIGPAGTGKSEIAKQVAGLLELPYYEAPMTAGATRGDLLGRHTIGGLDTAIYQSVRFLKGEIDELDTENTAGFMPAEFVKAYCGGGVFNFEEIDASPANMLIVLNNALASSELHNSADGKTYPKHPDFIPVSTANTFGLGANSQYAARERQDFAQLDRWRMGRVLVTLDEDLADHLMFG